MTRDFRKGAPPPRRRAERRGTCAFWFLTGGVLGAFGVGVAWLKQDPPPALAGLLQAPPAVATPAAPGDRPAPPKPQFDFYSLLPEEKVVVPPDTPPTPVELPPPGARPAAPAPPPPPAQASAPPPPPAPSGTGNYLLQVGSFKRTAEAEERKAQLALLGIQTSIQTVTAENGQTYYRVRTGAYDKANAAAVQTRLRQSGHDSMMIRAR